MARLRVPVQLRWSDVDGYAHVNNVAMLTILEESRIEAFWASPPSVDDAERQPWPTAVIDAGPGAETATLVARQQIEYLVPLAYRRAPVPAGRGRARGVVPLRGAAGGVPAPGTLNPRSSHRSVRARSATSAACAMLRCIPPKTTPWNGYTVHQ